MFSQRLKELRRENKVTQRDLAKLLEVDRTSITKWETTDVMPDGLMLSKIAKYFSVSIEYLIGTTNDRRRIEDIFSPSLEEVRNHAEKMNLTDDEKMALGILKGLPLSNQQNKASLTFIGNELKHNRNRLGVQFGVYPIIPQNRKSRQRQKTTGGNHANARLQLRRTIQTCTLGKRFSALPESVCY